MVNGLSDQSRGSDGIMPRRTLGHLSKSKLRAVRMPQLDESERAQQRGMNAEHLDLYKGKKSGAKANWGLGSSSEKMGGIGQVFMPLERSHWVGSGDRDSTRSWREGGAQRTCMGSTSEEEGMGAELCESGGRRLHLKVGWLFLGLETGRERRETSSWARHGENLASGLHVDSCPSLPMLLFSSKTAQGR